MKDTTVTDANAVARDGDGIEVVLVCDEDCPHGDLSEALDHLSEDILAFAQRVLSLQRQMAHGRSL
jgi:hypothetical protein